MTVFCGRGGGAVTRGETLAECLTTIMIPTIMIPTQSKGEDSWGKAQHEYINSSIILVSTRLHRQIWICFKFKPVDDWVKQTAHWGPTVNENGVLICQKYVPYHSLKTWLSLGQRATVTSFKDACLADLRWGEGTDMSSSGGGWTFNII